MLRSMLSLAFLIGAAGAAGPTTLMAQVPGKAVPISSTPIMTRFNPETNGFRFVNAFATVTGVFDITTSGLCGGMAYAALDYFLAGVPRPSQVYLPVQGSDLERFLSNRQAKSLEAHIDKWTELHLNPGGARNSEFFNWGLQGFRGGRLQELRAKIDAGQPVPLGLKSLSANFTEDHVVLAYGYDLGRYRGDLGQYKEDLKIFLYEPNFGNQKITLVPKPDRAEWCYVEPDNTGKQRCWRSYFVQQNYGRATPPPIPDNPVELELEFRTGGDDLRGGNDNLMIIVDLSDGRIIKTANVNRSKRWMSGSQNFIAVSLPNDVRAGGIREVTLATSFGGGVDGDNWNLDGFIAYLKVGGAKVQACNGGGAPLVRFTASTREYKFRMPCRP